MVLLKILLGVSEMRPRTWFIHRTLNAKQPTCYKCCICSLNFRNIHFATKIFDIIERKFTRRLIMVKLFYLDAKFLREYLKYGKNAFLKYHKNLSLPVLQMSHDTISCSFIYKSMKYVQTVLH